MAVDSCHPEIDASTPPLSPEACHALGEEIATFAAHVDVAMHAMLTRLRCFDGADGWGAGGFLSCAHWLAWRTHIGLKTAREHVRVARALGELAIVDAYFGRGELSYSKVRAITRVATAENEQEFVDIGMHATASQLERLLRSYGRCLDVATGGEAQALRGQRRQVHKSATVDGMVRIEIVLPPEEAAIVWDAIEAAIDSSGHTSEGAGAERCQASAEASGQAQASGQASGQASAEASLPAHQQTGQVPECPAAQLRADALVDVARAYLQHRPRTLGSAYELVVVTTQSQLESGPGGIGGFLRDGTPIPLHVARMLANDGSRVDVVVSEHGELLDVGRKTRAIPAAISRALWLRDGGCRVPGCGRSQHLHAHHIHGWAAGGSTSLNNLVLVCSSHHRMIHEGTLAVKLGSPRDLVGAGPKGAAEGRVVFLDQRGHTIPRFPATAANLAELEHYLHAADLHIDPSLTIPKWDGRPMDLQDSLSWMLMSGDKRLRGGIEQEPGD